MHIGTNGFSKSAPKEIFDNVLALKGIVASQNEKCKTIISTFTMCSDSSKNGCSPESNWNFERIEHTAYKKFEYFRKTLGIRGLHLNGHETSRLAMNHIVTCCNNE